MRPAITSAHRLRGKIGKVRRARKLTFNGETRTLVGWALWLGMDVDTIRKRLKANRTIAEALTVGRIPPPTPVTAARRRVG